MVPYQQDGALTGVMSVRLVLRSHISMFWLHSASIHRAYMYVHLHHEEAKRAQHQVIKSEFRGVALAVHDGVVCKGTQRRGLQHARI